MNFPSVTFTILIAAVLAGCKIQVTVPTSGSVVTESGRYICQASEQCVIDVKDALFDETFSGIANAGYFFRKWKKGGAALCGGGVEKCRLSTTAFKGNELLAGMIESDATFYLQPIFMLGECEDRSDEWIEQDNDLELHYRSQIMGCPDQFGVMQPHGLVLLWENNVLVSESRWDIGWETGVENEWWPNGKLKFRYVWREGLRAGPQRTYYPDGTLWSYEEFADGTWHGESRYYNTDGTLVVLQTLYKNILHGREQLYFESGQLNISRSYKNGELHGIEKIFYKNGTLREKRTYNNGVLTGPYTLYDSNGNIVEEGVN